jgi:hypothetical protein
MRRGGSTPASIVRECIAHCAGGLGKNSGGARVRTKAADQRRASAARQGRLAHRTARPAARLGALRRSRRARRCSRSSQGSAPRRGSRRAARVRHAQPRNTVGAATARRRAKLASERRVQRASAASTAVVSRPCAPDHGKPADALEELQPARRRAPRRRRRGSGERDSPPRVRAAARRKRSPRRIARARGRPRDAGAG